LPPQGDLFGLDAHILLCHGNQCRTSVTAVPTLTLIPFAFLLNPNQSILSRHYTNIKFFNSQLKNAGHL
jgi:hypothetical protein